MTFAPEGAMVVVTGGAGTIGSALVAEAAARGARTVVLCDLDEQAAARRAAELAADGRSQVVPLALDVADEEAVAQAVSDLEQAHGPVALWCSNAGVKLGAGLGEVDDWQTSLAVNVIGHVHMARHVVPRMLDRGRGHVVVTSSAAGLLSSPESAPYAVTKHASVALAEWMAIVYGPRGLGVACMCPQAVGRPMNAEVTDALTDLADGALPPAEVARDLFDGLAEGRFLILPHGEVADYERRRTGDRERWLVGMQRAVKRSASAHTSHS